MKVGLSSEESSSFLRGNLHLVKPHKKGILYGLPEY